MRSKSLLDDLLRNGDVEIIAAGEASVRMGTFKKELETVSGENDELNKQKVLDGTSKEVPEEEKKEENVPQLMRLMLIKMDELSTAFKVAKQKNPGLDVTGVIKKSEYWGQFVKTTEKFLERTHGKSEYMDTYSKLKKMVTGSATMRKVSGGDKYPFLYEGLECLFFEYHYHMMLSAYAHLRDGMETKDFADRNKLFATTSSIVKKVVNDEEFQKFLKKSNKIVNLKSLIKDVDTGAIADTPYWDNDDIALLAVGENLSNANAIVKEGYYQSLYNIFNGVNFVVKMVARKNMSLRYNVFPDIIKYSEQVMVEDREKLEDIIDGTLKEANIKDIEDRASIKTDYQKSKIIVAL